MYHKILVPLDGSKTAEAILSHVEELAICFQTKVTLLQVIEPAGDILRAGVFTRLADQLGADRKHAEVYLDGVKGRLQQKNITVETCVVVSGSPVDAIAETALGGEVDLIAMSSHGHTGMARVFYGSVAAGVLHRVDRPLLIIRSLD
jgi:nucleotide-binding universal stress UspA family protein